jgi:uncharacterized protein (DUF2249 family)
MSDVLIASNQADAEAADKVVEHHAAMSGRLGVLVGRLEAAQTGADALAARDELVDWARTDLVPHAEAEEAVLYAAAVTIPGHKVLVEAMIAEHRVLIGLIDTLAAADHPVRAIASAGGLRTLFETHVDKENTLVVPALVSSHEHSMATLLGQMHAALPAGHDAAEATHAAPAQQGSGHTCGCGGHDEAGMPVLDAREIPHAIRHATIFGALDGLQVGSGLILQADHDPVPLLMQLEQRAPGAFEISYLQRGPELFEIQLVRS